MVPKSPPPYISGTRLFLLPIQNFFFLRGGVGNSIFSDVFMDSTPGSESIIQLTKVCQSDIARWEKFREQWNGKSCIAMFSISSS